MASGRRRRKRCPRCKKLKPAKDFHVDSANLNNGSQGYCVSCRAAYDRDYRRRTAEARNAARKRKRRELTLWLREYRAEVGCAHCDEHRAACLDFHHLDPEQKLMGVIRMVQYGYSKESILREIEKCEVVCANCHRILHDDLDDEQPGQS